MKAKNTYTMSVYTLLLFLNTISFTAIAQVDPGPGPDAPIDGGLSLLLAAGAAYGVKKYRDHRRHTGKQDDMK